MESWTTVMGVRPRGRMRRRARCTVVGMNNSLVYDSLSRRYELWRMYNILSVENEIGIKF
jgi:hypothetical protein